MIRAHVPPRVGFIGFGRMGQALAAGAKEAGVAAAGRIAVFDTEPGAVREARRLGFSAVRSSLDLLQKSRLVFLCVKPQQMADALSAIAGGKVSNAALRKKVFVSIAAGVTLTSLERTLGRGVPVLRVMPNTPALLRAGMSAVSLGRYANARHQKEAAAILSAVGEVIAVPEKDMDAVTAVSGSGPAYVFYLAEGLLAAARAAGLNSVVAERLVRQTIYGAGLMLKMRPEPARELRRQVTSKGGTTAAAVAEFERKNLKPALASGVRQAVRRSRELSRLGPG
jgi:pyrroline-5-carboxylate reductase